MKFGVTNMSGWLGRTLLETLVNTTDVG